MTTIEVVGLKLPEEYEIVERKGIGHPDSLADGIAEAVSIALCREYRKRFGAVQHHNVDKVTIVAGASRPSFGGGEILEPIKVIIAGRGNPSVPLQVIAKKAAWEYFKSVVELAEREHLQIMPMIGKGSSELVATVKNIRANDTSVGVGFWPLTPLEELTLNIGKFLESREFRKEWPEVGPDIKVMAHRLGSKIGITVAIAYIDRFLNSLDAYKRSKEAIREEIISRFDLRGAEVEINALDDFSEGLVYLTVLGTSAEQGDDGATGRGNRINGLITPLRPMSMEAAAGKNPISHVGKIYNAAAQEIAREIFETTGKPAEVLLRSKIGAPLEKPEVVLVKTQAEKKAVEQIVQEYLESRLYRLVEDLTKGKIPVF